MKAVVEVNLLVTVNIANNNSDDNDIKDILETMSINSELDGGDIIYSQVDSVVVITKEM